MKSSYRRRKDRRDIIIGVLVIAFCSAFITTAFVYAYSVDKEYQSHH